MTVEVESAMTKPIDVGKEKPFSAVVAFEQGQESNQDVTLTTRLVGSSEAVATIERVI